MAMVSSFADDGPSFHTFMHCRRIPAGFKGIIGGRFPCVIHLKGSSGHRFKVVVYKDDDGNMSMQEGLKDFMLANEISISNFLLFHYDGNLSFHVQVFNSSGVERVPENQEQRAAIATSDGKRNPGRPRKYDKKDHGLQAKKEGGYQDYEKEPSKKIPAFFKAFITQDAQHRLTIPLAFTEYIEGMISFTAFLRDRKSNVWTVETTESRKQYSFDDGWPKFVKENDVQLGDFLVFQYDGKCRFDFKHFGSSMCEKEAKISKFKVKEEEEEEGNDKETETAETRYADLDNIYGDVHDEDNDKYDDNEDDEDDDDDDYDDNEDDEDEDDDMVLEEKDVDEDLTEKVSGSNEDDDDYNYEEGDKDDDNYDDDEDNDSDVVVVEEKDVDEDVFKKEYDNDDATNEENAIFESGIVERPKINPYFVAKIHPSHRSYLSVPSDVIKHFNLKLPEYLFIFVKHGRGWKTKVNVWKDGRTCLSRGWRPFCKWNNVQLNDRCICEFVPRDGGRIIFLQIRIVRAGSW